MVVFTLLVKTIHVFAIFLFKLDRGTWQWKAIVSEPWTGGENHLGEIALHCQDAITIVCTKSLLPAWGS